jgi:hypothetical protein
MLDNRNKKLLSAGCSFIYGAELSDSSSICGRDPPSVKTWPALYAKEKNLNYHTCAQCGLSNQGIVRYVMDALETYYFDYIIVQWTFYERYEIRLNSKDLSDQQSYYYLITPWMSSNLKICHQEFLDVHPIIKSLATSWYKNVDSDETEYYYYLKSKIELANYLRYKKIPFVFCNSQSITVESDMISDLSLKNLIHLSKDIPEIDFDGKGFYQWSKVNQFSFGKNHPLDDAHQSAFEKIKSTVDSYLGL